MADCRRNLGLREAEPGRLVINLDDDSRRFQPTTQRGRGRLKFLYANVRWLPQALARLGLAAFLLALTALAAWLASTVQGEHGAQLDSGALRRR